MSSTTDNKTWNDNDEFLIPKELQDELREMGEQPKSQPEQPKEPEKKINVEHVGKEGIPLKYDTLDKDCEGLAEEMVMYENLYFGRDLPIPYKEGLTIYPVKLENYNAFTDAIKCLTLNKPKKVPQGSTKDQIRAFIKMNNLDYLISIISTPELGKIYSQWLLIIIDLCFHVKNGIYCKNCQKDVELEEVEKQLQEQLAKDQKDDQEFTLKCPHCNSEDVSAKVQYITDDKNHKEILIKDVHITGTDFEKIRKIILFQNLPDYRDDSYVDEDLKNDYEERMRLQSKGHGSASIEDKVSALSTYYHIFDENRWYKLPIRRFLTKFSRMDDLLVWQFKMQGLYSGLSGIKPDQIEHWIYKKEKDMYGNAYQDYDQMKEKVNSI